MDDYRRRVAEAGPWLREGWNMSGFWVDRGQEGQRFGADPPTWSRERDLDDPVDR